MRVFVTGATGLVGSHVAEQLRARGDEVLAMVRPSSARDFLAGIGCTFVDADMATPAAELADAMRGCDALVHAAALVGARTDAAHYDRVNVLGTRNVFDAARIAGVPRAVHVSSVAVYGGLVDGPITEERWREVAITPRSAYSASKRAAEEIASGTTGVAVSSVRPCVIYGERDRHVVPRLDRMTRLPVLPLPHGGNGSLPLVYAGNVARGILACLDRPHTTGRAYNLAVDDPLNARQLIEWWCQARGRRTPKLVPIPGRVVEGAATVVDAVAGALPILHVPTLTRPARLLRGPNPYDSSRARRELDWTDLVPARQAIKRTAQSLS